MMVVVCLRGGEEREVVAAVGDGGVEDGHGIPEPGNGYVRAHDPWAQPQGEHVGDNMLQGVRVHC